MSVSTSGRPKAVNLSQKALTGLRQMVLGGKLSPGERLFEVPLSEQLGISRTPVREALSRLESEGLLERIASGGYMVREFSVQDVLDAIELRSVLEGVAARLAAERGISDEDLGEVRDLLDKIDEVLKPAQSDRQFAQYVELNEDFHARLAELSGSKLIKAEVTRAVALPFASPSAFLHNQAVAPEYGVTLAIAQSQHRAILDAIENREGSRAEAIAREHGRVARGNLKFIVNNKDSAMIQQLPALALLSA